MIFDFDDMKNGFYQYLFSNILFPVYDKIHGRNTLEYLEEYEKSQWCPPDEIQNKQLKKLKLLIKHCAENVPYYRRLWKKEGINWHDINSIEDYTNLPILTKKIIRENYNDLIAENYRGHTASKATGGSTGIPLKFEYTDESNDRRNAVTIRGYAWAGLSPGQRSLHLWGADILPQSFARRLKVNLFNAFFARKVLNSFDLNNNNLDIYLENINRHKPEVIVSYVMPLVTLAEYVIHKKKMCWSPHSIITGAEPLFEYQREIIEKAFGSKVFNTYGSREFMLIAAECNEHSGLHVNSDHLCVEVTNNGLPVEAGSMGDITITDLHNYGMPFIRYQIGDMGKLGSKTCQCGRGLPKLDSIDGRKLDIIRTVDGRIIPGEFFPHLFKDFAGIDRFQIVQNELSSLDINIVRNRNFVKKDEELLKSLIISQTGKDTRINFNFMDDIALTPSGKHRVTISNITGL